MIGRNRLDRRDIEFFDHAAQRQRGTRDLAGETVQVGAILARVEEDRAAILDIGVELGEGCGRWRLRIGQNGPVDQRKEDNLIAIEIDGDRLAWLD